MYIDFHCAYNAKEVFGICLNIIGMLSWDVSAINCYCRFRSFLFVDSFRPINNLSVKQGLVFLG